MKDIRSLDCVYIVTGFGYSGSGLINDYFINQGFCSPSNIRMVELNSGNNGFTWASLLDGKYNSFKSRFQLKIILFCIVIVRIFKKIIKRTFIYKIYQSKRYSKTTIETHFYSIHRIHSAENSIKSALNNFLLNLTLRGNLEERFFNWMSKKFSNITDECNKLILDKGATKDERILGWLNKTQTFKTICVFRDPMTMFAQQDMINSGLVAEYDYKESLDFRIENLRKAYSNLLGLATKFSNVLPVHFDDFLTDQDYRDVINHTIKNMTNNKSYNFNLSLENDSLIKSSEYYVYYKKNEHKFIELLEYHLKFQSFFYRNVALIGEVR